MLNTRRPIIHTTRIVISTTLLILTSTANAHIAYQGGNTQGATTALTTDTNNRQLDQNEQTRIARLAKDQAHKASPNTTPEQRTAGQQYWQGLLTSEALGLTDDRDHKDRMNYVDDIIGTIRPGTEGYYYAPNYINDTYTARALLYQHSGAPILGSDGRPLISNGAPLTLFRATPEQRLNHDLFAIGPAGNSVSLPFVWENRHNPNAAADYDASQSANTSVLSQDTLDRQRFDRYRTLNGSAADSPVGPEDLVPGLGTAAKGVLRVGRVVGEGMWGWVGRSWGVAKEADTLRRFVRQSEFDAIQQAQTTGSNVTLGRFFTPDKITDPRVAASQLALPGVTRNPIVGYVDVPRSVLSSEPLSAFGPRLVQPFRGGDNVTLPGLGLEVEFISSQTVPSNVLRLVPTP